MVMHFQPDVYGPSFNQIELVKHVIPNSAHCKASLPINVMVRPACFACESNYWRVKRAGRGHPADHRHICRADARLLGGPIKWAMTNVQTCVPLDTRVYPVAFPRIAHNFCRSITGTFSRPIALPRQVRLGLNWSRLRPTQNGWGWSWQRRMTGGETF